MFVIILGIIHIALGIRLAVGHLTLDQAGQVRILDPQPDLIKPELSFDKKQHYIVAMQGLVESFKENVLWQRRRK